MKQRKNAVFSVVFLSSEVLQKVKVMLVQRGGVWVCLLALFTKSYVMAPSKGFIICFQSFSRAVHLSVELLSCSTNLSVLCNVLASIYLLEEAVPETSCK